MKRTLAVLAAVAALAAVTGKPVCDSPSSCRGALLTSAAQLQSRPASDTQQAIQKLAQKFIEPLFDAPPSSWKDGGGGDIDKTWCPKSTYFDFLPVELATLSLGQAVNWTSQCFGSVVATTHVSGGQANVTITGSSPSGLLCSDTLLVITSYRVVKLLTPSALSPVASTTFTLENSEAKDLFAGGFKVLLLPCGVVGSIESVVATVSLFLGDDEAQYQRNMDFLTQRGVWPAATPFNKTVALPADKTLIPSGTYLAIGRLDGLDPTIMWLTGGLTGHSAVAVWEGDTLYVVESTAPDPLGKVYWPCANGYCGIMRTEWSLWNSRAIAADYHVSVLALADPYAAAFDEDAFWKYFATVEGTPYGYVSMVNVATGPSL
ncbi:unnamed protein product [Symbiodinium sp. KB8]|nr:unnamed protein product [Symbiodinium sp. KB8]